MNDPTIRFHGIRFNDPENEESSEEEVDAAKSALATLFSEITHHRDEEDEDGAATAPTTISHIETFSPWSLRSPPLPIEKILCYDK